jgi:hypothetical protein
MKLKNLALGCTLLICCALAASGQETKCNLKITHLESVPELRGFRLGMTLEQFSARVPKLNLRPADEFGATAINIYPEYNDNLDRATFAGIRTISLEFLDSRVVSLWVGYAPDFKWKSNEEFLAQMTRALHLPNLWQTKSRGQQLTCDDFQINIYTIGGNPSIRFTDEAAHRTLEQRKAAKDEAEEKPR